MHYCADAELAFTSVVHLTRDVNYGWLLRSLHANGASLFFLLIYLHLGRGLYFSSYTSSSVFLSGLALLVLIIGTSFLGYVLPWGQISFWAATVITNLLRVIPFIGSDLVS